MYQSARHLSALGRETADLHMPAFVNASRASVLVAGARLGEEVPSGFRVDLWGWRFEKW